MSVITMMFFFSVGFGYTSPATTGGQVACISFAILSVPINILFMNLVLEISVAILTKSVNFLRGCSSDNQGNNISNTANMSLISVLFMGTVLVMALIFAYIEDWSYFEGIYFVIIAFTTIGLGDLVPSSDISEHNTHEAYRVLNWFLVMFGVLVTYVFLSLMTISIKIRLQNLIRKRKNLKCVSTSSESVITAPSVRRISSTGSMVEDGVGPFAAVQRAIHKMRLKAEYDEEVQRELKAIEAIEAIINREIQKIQMRQGKDPKTVWRRAAAKARIDSATKDHASDVDVLSLYDMSPDFNLKIRKLHRHSVSPMPRPERYNRHRYSLTPLPNERLPQKQRHSIANWQMSTLSPQAYTNQCFDFSQNRKISKALNRLELQVSSVFDLQTNNEEPSPADLTVRPLRCKNRNSTVTQQTESTYVRKESVSSIETLSLRDEIDNISEHMTDDKGSTESRETTAG